MSEQSTSTTEQKPALEVVRKYNTKQLITFFRGKEDLQLDDDDYAILHNEKIAGRDFLIITKQEFERYGMKGGPATRLVDFAKEIKREQLIATEVRKKITDAFPRGLPYQSHYSALLVQIELKNHYENFTLRRFDKTTIPLYLFLSRAGTGKSRNANEFHRTAISCLSAQEDQELLTRIKKAWVFLISLENGTSLLPMENPYFAIGTRMLFQLLRMKMSLCDVIRAYEPPDPLKVVSLEDSQFYKTLSGIADLALKGTFLIPLCTSTITGEVENSLKHSHRNHVYLPVVPLEPSYQRQEYKIVLVFNDDEVTNVLVQDCGGHGRALEVLNNFLDRRDIKKCNFNTLMHDLRLSLTETYHNAILGSIKYARPLIRAILTRRCLDLFKTIPKTDITPDDLVGSGLIRFERISNNSPMGYLTAPYIWLWIFAEMSHKQGDTLIRDWGFTDYTEQRVLSNPVSPLHPKSWQDFKKFVTSFRCIKSDIIEEDEPTTMSEVHAGARLNGDIQFKNHNLEFQVATHQTDTNSENHTASKWDVECQDSAVDVRQFKHCIINASSSPYGDAFLSLDRQDTKISNEVHQYKLMKKSITQEEYIQEREKSASKNDFFILFTTAENCNINLPKNSGIVDGKAFNDYFGPYAGRAYKCAISKFENTSKLKINIASFKQLCGVYQIGKKRADMIISTRPFEDIKEANLKTKIPIKPSYDFSQYTSIHVIKISQNGCTIEFGNLSWDNDTELC
ncbi:hypothetical protein Glove_114g37 [Diversispora epigaea]|uniref:SAM domain-containing protein n=1 Tax=Diversispora epigaea TaxID=1348612 RepID=A0A397J190_9GLOM|nr:hypothetical protein Glove_114g37 [Diversispora epigaea]